MTKSVAILGCGPAGLMVAHAATLSGWDFRIYSRKVRSPLHGAQYLHQPIPNVNGGPKYVDYQMRGRAEDYRRKVYGDTWDGTVSPEDFPEPHAAWDLREAYARMWDRYEPEIIDIDFREKLLANLVHDLTVNCQTPDVIISTVPRTLWDDDNSHFKRSYIWALGDGDYERVHLHRPPPFTVICDGTRENQWYRVSNIFDHCTMEWPQWYNRQNGHQYGSVTPPARGAALVVKPLEYTGNAAMDFIHLGRYAEWTKGVLTSDVFFEAMKVFARDSIEAQ